MPNKFTQFFNRIFNAGSSETQAPVDENISGVVPSPHIEDNVAALARSVAADEVKRQIEIARADAPAGFSANTGFASILAIGQNTPSSFGAVHFDNPIVFSTPQSPKRRPRAYVTVEQLRTFADNYDVLRSCIQHLKREVSTVPIEIIARNRKDTGANRSAIKQAEMFFAKPGGLGGISKERSWFENALLEDLMVVGVACAFYHPTKSGGVYQIVELDASTIRPRTDAFGWPGPGENKYEQWILGLPWAGYKEEQIAFMGLPQNTRSYTPYPASPVEWLLNVVRGAISADLWNLAWLTEGSTPNDMVALPSDWTPTQIREFEQYFNAMLAGDINGRQRTKFVPGGSQKVGNPGRKDQDFGEYELWLMRRTCSVMGVAPASIGYAGDQYKESQGDSMRNTSAFGAGALLAWRKEFYDDVLYRIGLSQLEILNLTDAESSSRDRAEINRLTVGVPHRTINDARREDGIDPIEGGDVILVPNNVATLADVLAGNVQPKPALPDPAAPTDPLTESGKDDDDTGDMTTGDDIGRTLGQWRKKSTNRLREGKSPACSFISDVLPPIMRAEITDNLLRCKTAADIHRVFAEAMKREV